MSNITNKVVYANNKEDFDNFYSGKFSECSTYTKVSTIEENELEKFIEENNCEFLLMKYFRKKSNMKNILLKCFSEENSKNEYIYNSFSLEDVKSTNVFDYKNKLDSLFQLFQSEFDKQSKKIKRETQKVDYMLIVDKKKKLFTLTSIDSINCSLFEIEKYYS